jgi:hypothetical protein
MLVFPDAVDYNNNYDNNGDSKQYRPNFQNQVCNGIDEKSAERQHKCELQYPGNELFG